MASKIDVINAAFHKLGVARLTSLSEDNERTTIATEIYDDQREHVLRAHPWNFAIERASLAALSAAPEWGFDNAFQLPGDCLRVLNTDYDVDGVPVDWHVEGRKIITDLGPPLLIRYIKDVQDETQMDALFRELLACRLAMVLAESLTGSGELSAKMTKEYEDKLISARGADGQEGSSPKMQATSWILARRSGASGGL